MRTDDSEPLRSMTVTMSDRNTMMRMRTGSDSEFFEQQRDRAFSSFIPTTFGN